MMHGNECILSIGISGSGKTSIAQILVKQEIDKGNPVPIVLDPNVEPQWYTPEVTKDSEKFIEKVRRWGNDKDQFYRPRKMVVVDEGYRFVDHYTSEFEFMLREKRHNAIRPVVTAHREQDLHKTARRQADRLFLFQSSPGDAELFAEEWMCPDLVDAPYQDDLQFMDTQKGGPIYEREIKF